LTAKLRSAPHRTAASCRPNICSHAATVEDNDRYAGDGQSGDRRIHVCCGSRGGRRVLCGMAYPSPPTWTEIINSSLDTDYLLCRRMHNSILHAVECGSGRTRHGHRHRRQAAVDGPCAGHLRRCQVSGPPYLTQSSLSSRAQQVNLHSLTTPSTAQLTTPVTWAMRLSVQLLVHSTSSPSQQDIGPSYPIRLATIPASTPEVPLHRDRATSCRTPCDAQGTGHRRPGAVALRVSHGLRGWKCRAGRGAAGSL
jgi:hypothetical protein